jgi:clan AA aspartic protease
MNGVVDSAGRALLDIELKATRDAPALSVTAWIDTGFTGDLVLPQTIVDDLALTLTGTVSAVLADGSQIAMKTYRCFVQWFDELRRLEIVANEGEHPLLGVGLLLDHELRIDYRSKVITVA